MAQPEKSGGQVGLLPTALGRMKERRKQRRSRTAGDLFRDLAQRTAGVVGSGWAFLVALIVVILWAASGPLFGFSDTWQLVINTGTTIVTFLMVFIIQNAQNRDAKALHLKLDELIHSIHGARNELIDLEECSEAEVAELETEFKRLATRRESA
jgi:low affinity Fe/Cu permease